MGIGDQYQTCERSSVDANYKCVKYTDGTTYPSPTSDEMEIKLEKGEHFPPIRSCDKGAIWEMTYMEVLFYLRKFNIIIIL